MRLMAFQAWIAHPRNILTLLQPPRQLQRIFRMPLTPQTQRLDP